MNTVEQDFDEAVREEGTVRPMPRPITVSGDLLREAYIAINSLSDELGYADSRLVALRDALDPLPDLSDEDNGSLEWAPDNGGTGIPGPRD